MPKVVGTRLTRAKKMLEDAGFKVGKTVYSYDPCCGEYIILRQTPPEGEAPRPEHDRRPGRQRARVGPGGMTIRARDIV